MALSYPQNFLAVSLTESLEGRKNVLHSLLVFHVSNDSPLGLNNKEGKEYLNILYNHKFESEGENSGYGYLNFEYTYLNLPLLIAA
jgi:hypothetical protein